MNYLLTFVIYMIIPSIVQTYRVFKNKDHYNFNYFLIINFAIYFSILIGLQMFIPEFAEFLDQ